MAPELLAILHAQEMKGERLVNHIRLVFVTLSILMTAGVWQINQPAANTLFAIQLGAWLAFSVGMYLYFRVRGATYTPWLKFVSIAVDLGLLAFSAVAMSHNHSGILEYFQGFMPLTYVFWNLVSGLRYRLSACVYSAAVTALLNGIVLWYAVSSGAVEVSGVSVYGKPAINVGDQLVQIFFMAIPGILAGIIARIARDLLVRAEDESRQRARLEREREQLGKYLSKDLVEAVIAQGHLELGGARRTATIMFTDIRSFTPLSEARQPEEVVTLLNAYFTEMVAIVFRYGGMLDKFLGDGLMAVYGAPFDMPDAPRRAVLVAIEMFRAMEAFNQRMEARGLPKLDMGVGIATGEVVAGNIGSPDRMEYTCIGDAVNFSSRLQSLSRDLGAHIVISEATAAAIEEPLPLRRLPPLKVKGKRDEVPVLVLDPLRVTAAQLLTLRNAVLGTTVERRETVAAA